MLKCLFFAFLRGIFEVKTPRCLYRRRFRGNPAAPKSPLFRFIHSVFQSLGTLSTAPLPTTLEIAIYAYSAPIRVTAIHSISLVRSLQNLLRAVCRFILVLEPKVFRQSKVQVLPILAGQMDGKRDLWHHESTAHSQKHFRKIWRNPLEIFRKSYIFF